MTVVDIRGVSGTNYMEAPRESLSELVAEGLSAFQADPRYVIAMARHSSMVLYKRELWNRDRDGVAS